MKKIKIKLAALFVFCIVILFISCVCSTFKTFGAEATQPDAVGNYYYSDYKSKSEATTAGNELNKKIYGEGIVLLKNDGNLLPLDSARNISVFGRQSASLRRGGTGAGAGTGVGNPITLYDSLRSAGFILNPLLVNLYGSGITNSGDMGDGSSAETSTSSYTSSIVSSYVNYSDAAIIVISRGGRENGEFGQGSATSDHGLQLTANERSLISHVGEHFNDIIMIFNTGDVFDVSFLDDPGQRGYNANIKAALWAGFTGTTGADAIGKVLKGTINPSGKSTNIWSRDYRKDPSYSNSKTTTYASGGGNKIYYKESIYLGYRYYETRGVTEGNGKYTTSGSSDIYGTSTKTWTNWYDAHVVYPFGHGLSYTDFSWEVLDTSTSAGQLGENDTITVNVKVTNTGEVAGKDVVQLYYTAPYETGKIEKAHVVLGDFKKTGAIDPGESEIVTLKLSVRDMASYDRSDANKNDFKGYELDGGDYTIKIMRNSHDVVDSITYTVPAGGYQYRKDVVTDYDVINRYDDVSEETIVAGNGKLLSRADFSGTFPETVPNTYARKQWIVDMASYRPDDDAPGQPYYKATAPTTGAAGTLMLKDFVGLDYDDPLWDAYLDRFTRNDMIDLLDGFYAFGRNMPQYGITRTVNADGATGWYYGTSGNHVHYSAESVLAATWNRTIAYEKGVMLANEGLLGGIDGGDYRGAAGMVNYPGLYAPAVNLHRSRFNGRNFEYYSEDGILSGKLSTEFVLGARSKGLVVYVKHFALFDYAVGGNLSYVWADEQAMRELYFKPFKLCVKEGKTTGIMAAENRIGPTWSGGCYELNTNILRNEWGFKGVLVSDWAGNINYFNGGGYNPSRLIRSGGNLILGAATNSGSGGSGSSGLYNTSTELWALRNAIHGLCYTMANSFAMNASMIAYAEDVVENFTGKSITKIYVGVECNLSIATATINKELYPDGDDSEIEYILNAGSTLPEGLTLDSRGTIHGTPTVLVNNHMFTATAIYRGFSKEANFSITVLPDTGSIIYQTETADDANIVFTINESSEADVGFAVIDKPNMEPGEILPSISYRLKAGSTLMRGLTLSSDGIISGTPTFECEYYSFSVIAFADGFEPVEYTFTLSVLHNLAFTAKILKTGRSGETYFDSVAQAVSDKTVTYRATGDLPQGLTLTAGGSIVGIPETAVTDYKFTVLAEADFCETVAVEYSITIGLKFDETKDTILAEGNVGEEYTAYIDFATGALSGMTYSVKSGSELPAGLILDESGEITGTPTKAGTYKLTIVVSADGLISDEIELQVRINGDNGEVSEGCGSVIFTNGGTVAAIGITFAVAIGLTFVLRRKETELNKNEEK